MVRSLVVRHHMIKLRGGLVEDARPRMTTIVGDARAAVVALDQAIRVVWVDPQAVVVAVRRGNRLKALAAVDGLPAVEGEHPDGVRVLRVGIDVHVVPRAPTQVRVVANSLPGIAVVIGTEERAVFRLHQCPHPPCLRGGRGDTDLPQNAFRQARVAADVGPGITTVERAPDTAVLTAATGGMGIALPLPDGGVEHAGVGRVHRDIVRTGAVAFEEDVLPRGPAVTRAIHAPVGVRSPRMTERRDVGGVGIVGMHEDITDMARGGKADICPGASAVSGLIHAVTMRDIAADRRFARTGIDHIGIGGGNGERAHRSRLKEPVRDIGPVGAAVCGLPDPACRPAKVECRYVRGMTGNRDHTPTPVRSDAPPFQRTEKTRIHLAFSP